MKATITEIKEPKSGTSKNGHPWFIQHFTAGGVDLQTGDKELAGKLKVGLVCEIKYESKTDGQYTNNNVTELTIVDEPIFPEQPKNEAVRVVDDTRNSIEDQVRAKIIAELCACGFLTKEDVEVPKLRYWLQKLSPNIQESPLVAQAKAAGAKVVK